MSDELLITLSSPPVWPFSSPTIPPGVTASGRSYKANSGGQVDVVPLDVGGLLSMGFSLSASVGIIGKYLGFPCGDQNGVNIGVPIKFTPGAKYVITDIIAISTNDVAANGGTIGVLQSANDTTFGLGSIQPAWNAVGHYFHWNVILSTVVTANPLWFSTEAPNWSPVDAGTVCDIYILGYQTA